MPTLKGKPSASQSWLPTQVSYGIDCSDPDPERWTSFGSVDDSEKARAAEKADKHGAKSDHRLQPGPTAP